jgi:hypothetical protein
MQKVWVVTANRTRDGRAVYLTADKRWSEELGQAAFVEAAGLLDAPLAWARSQQREVCDPYVLKLAQGPEGLVATTTRERIRAVGPRWVAERFGYRI